MHDFTHFIPIQTIAQYFFTLSFHGMTYIKQEQLTLHF